MIKKLETIAKEELHIPTLETRKMDDLDFHSVAVWSVRRALTDAYKGGLEDQATALLPKGAPRIWGYPVRSFVGALRELGYGWKDSYAALISFGLLPGEAQQFYMEKPALLPVVLTPTQQQMIHDRIQLYRSEG